MAAKKKRFEAIVKKLNEDVPSIGKSDRDPTLEELAGAVAMWALQHGHDKESTVGAISDAFDAIEP